MPRAKRISDAAALDGALRAMAATGPDGFTLTAVASETGLAPATLMQRFGAKQTLIVRAIEHGDQAFARLLAEAPPVAGRDAVLDLFWLLTPDVEDPAALANHLRWRRQDLRHPEISALARSRLRLLCREIAARLPPLALKPETAAVLLEAQWQGALDQWALLGEGRLADYVAARLNDWFDLAGAP